MGEGGGGEEKGSQAFLSFSSLPFSLPSFLFSPRNASYSGYHLATRKPTRRREVTGYRVDQEGEDGQKRIKMKTMTENIAGACVCSMRIEFNLRPNVQFYRFRTFWRGQTKTPHNGSVDAN